MNSVDVGHSQRASVIKAILHCTVLYKSEYLVITLTGQDGGDRLHVLVIGHAGLAVGPVLENRLHDGAHGKEGGRRGVQDAGIGISAFLFSFYSHQRGLKKANLHCTVLYKLESLSS